MGFVNGSGKKTYWRSADYRDYNTLLKRHEFEPCQCKDTIDAKRHCAKIINDRIIKSQRGGF